MKSSFVFADKAVLRVLDANLNRAREGLRVGEEVARLILADFSLTRRFQKLRYSLEKLRNTFGGDLLPARDARRDVGRPSGRKPASRYRNTRDLVSANLRRVEEALRVLEEFSRFRSIRAAQSFGLLRFRTYTLEQEILSKLPALRHR